MTIFLKNYFTSLKGMMLAGIMVIIFSILALQSFNYSNFEESHSIIKKIASTPELKDTLKQFEIHTQETLNFILILTAFIAVFLFSIYLIVNHLLNQQLQNTVQSLNKATEKIAITLDGLKTTGSSLATSTTASATSLENTVASVEELSSMVQMNTDNAKQAAALSHNSKDIAEKGETEIKTLIQSIGEISQSSQKIEEIITVIDDIAFQTNLLALNAAVEAARAGEQGRGFAVVADAVRTLAQRSASAAKDITSLIKQSVHQIEESKTVADESGTVLVSIVTSAKKVSDLNEEISTASAEQASGIMQISSAMNHIDQVSQTNAGTAEKITQISSDLTQQLESLQKLIQQFNKTIVGGNIDMNQTELVQKKTKKIDFSVKLEKIKEKPNETSKDNSKKSNVIKLNLAKEKPVHQTIAPLKQTNTSKSKAEELIPFDDDSFQGKVGTTEEF